MRISDWSSDVCSSDLVAQHPDYNLPNAPGPEVRSHLNSMFEAAVTNNSGDTEPPSPRPFMWWADTTNGLMKIRNAANSAWVTIGALDVPNFGLATRGANTFTGVQNYNGNTLSRAVLRDYGEKVNALGDVSGTVAISTADGNVVTATVAGDVSRSEEHTSELQSLMRRSYAVFCLKKK